MCWATDELHLAHTPTDATNTHLVKDAMVLIFLARKFLPFWQSKECMGVLENSVHREQQTVVLCLHQSEIYPEVMYLHEGDGRTVLGLLRGYF